MVKIFLDSARIEEIRSVKESGILDGITTNPSLIKKASDEFGGSIENYIKEILKTVDGPVSLEVIGTTYDEMIEEGEKIYRKFNPIAKNVYIKIPANPCMDKNCKNNFDGIRAIKTLSKKGIPVNCTLVFSPEQALLAAKAGAKFVSPFVGRVNDFIRKNHGVRFKKEDYFPAEGMKKGTRILDDKGIVSGVDLIAKIREMFDRENIKTEILAASIRNQQEFRESTLAGADIVTAPFEVIEQFPIHAKTYEGMQDFAKDTVPEYAKLLEGK